MPGACIEGLQLPEGDPGAVEDAASAMRRCAGGFEGAGGTAAAAAKATPGWNGLASFQFRASCGNYRSAAHAAEAVCHQAATALTRYGHELRDGREHVERLQRRGDVCVERIHTAQRTAGLAGEREAAARRLAYQADFLAGADGGSLRARADHDAAEAAAERRRAEHEEKLQRDELKRLQHEAERVRERVKDAGRRAAAEISSMALDMPTVSYPGAPVTPITGSGPRPDTNGGALNVAKNVAGDLSGVNDAKEAWNDFGHGDIVNGLIHTAFALPFGVGKIGKLGKLGEEGAERIGKKLGEDEGERIAREGLPKFKGTPGERLPPYSGGKTEGVVDVGGRQYDIKSGYDGPSATRANGTTPGSNWRIRSHVEAHVAALMRNDNIKKAELWINRDPCAGANGCDAMLPRMLPPGSKLTIHLPDGTSKVYEGLPD